MAEITLITANKNYCNWPLPASLCLRVADLDFDEVIIPFGEPDSRDRFEELTPTGSVPALKHGDLTNWDSLAICEYVAEIAPVAGLWPTARSIRAVARSVVADIHSFSGRHTAGVQSASSFMPTNIRQRGGPIVVPEDIQMIFDRHTKIWRECRAKHASDGPYLFVQFSIADAMSASLVNRFVTYNVQLDAIAAAYRDTVRDHPRVKEYVALAEVEPWVYEPSERPFS